MGGRGWGEARASSRERREELRYSTMGGHGRPRAATGGAASAAPFFLCLRSVSVQPLGVRLLAAVSQSPAILHVADAVDVDFAEALTRAGGAGGRLPCSVIMPDRQRRRLLDRGHVGFDVEKLPQDRRHRSVEPVVYRSLRAPFLLRQEPNRQPSCRR
jgi:hypothetical protein